MQPVASTAVAKATPYDGALNALVGGMDLDAHDLALEAAQMKQALVRRHSPFLIFKFA